MPCLKTCGVGVSILKIRAVSLLKQIFPEITDWKLLIMSENKSSSRHLTRKCKVLIQILADVFAFILSYAVSIVVSRFNAGDYALSSAAVCVITLDVLYLLRYYSAKIEMSSIELSQRCLKGVAAVYIASAVISLAAGQSDFAVFNFLYLTYFFIFSLGARFIFKVMLQKSFEERIPESCCIRSRRHRYDACTSVFQRQA